MIDERDRAILRVLQADGRMPNSEIAERVNLSESACLRRLRLLEASGVIAGYTVIVDQKTVGLPLSVFLTITLTSQSEAVLASFETAVRTAPEIMECYLITGNADYLLRVVVSDIEAYERLHLATLTRLPGVLRIATSIALRTAVRKNGLPL